MRLISLLMLMSSLLLLPARTSQATGKADAVNTDQVKVTLVPDKSVIMLGEPTFLTFTVQNHSDQALQVMVGGDYRNALGRPESFAVTVVREDGKRVPQPDAGPGFGGLFGPQKLPAHGSYTFKLFLPHWAAFEETGVYSVVAKRTLKLNPYTPDKWDFQETTTDVPVQANTKIEVVPQDSEKMGAVIAALGDSMLSGQAETRSASRMLSYIQDERVIPYFIKALGTRRYDEKMTALHALAKFDNEAAFQALKKGMETRGKDVGNATTQEFANQLADNIRLTAAVALAKNPHPGAIPFLLSRRNDASEGVRVTILHVLGRMRPKDALPILREMTQDKSKLVSDEAKRYLQQLSSPQ